MSSSPDGSQLRQSFALVLHAASVLLQIVEYNIVPLFRKTGRTRCRAGPAHAQDAFFFVHMHRMPYPWQVLTGAMHAEAVRATKHVRNACLSVPLEDISSLEMKSLHVAQVTDMIVLHVTKIKCS